MPPTGSFVPPPAPDQAGDEVEKQWILDQFYGGISDAEKQIVRTTYLLEKQYQFLFAQNGNILEYPNWFQINKASIQDSPSSGPNMITALPKWIVSGDPYTDQLYIYCADGKMFSRNTNGEYTYLFTAQDSQGNGMDMALGYLYYTTNSSIGIYGPIGSPTATNQDAYLTQGLQNTKSTGIAPVQASFNNVNVGHGNYLGTFDPLTSNWTSAYLVADEHSYIRSFSTTNQMLAVGVGTVGTLNNNFGYIYIWDGQSTNWNAFTPTDGPIDILQNWENNLLTIIGAQGMLYTGMSPIQAQQRFPKLTHWDTISVLPGATTEFKGQAMFGIAGATTSSTLQQGVYHWGNRNDNYPPAMNFDYTISTGNTTNIQIGALYGSSTQLFIGWADNNLGTYGVDVVQQSNPYYSSAFVQGVITDDMRPVDDKNVLTVRASHLPLKEGESIQLGFSINRGVWVLSTLNEIEGSVLTEFPIIEDYAQFKELQIEAILGSPGTTTPSISSIGAAYMPLLTQSQY